MGFCFVLFFTVFISSFIAVYTIKSLHTLVIGRDSKSRQQMSAVLSIKGGKASTEHSVSGTTEVKRKSDPQDTKLLEVSKGHVFLLVLEV